MKLTNHLRKYLGLLAFLLTSLSVGANAFALTAEDMKAEKYIVTEEMLADGEAADGIGKEIYKFLQLGGDKSALTPEQLKAAEGYYDRYMDSPFFGLSNLWVLIAAFLVFVMHLGFSTLESGLTQAKNTVNILFKNVFIISSGLILYFLWGFNAMYPGDGWEISNIFAMGSPWDGAPKDNGDLTYGGTALLMTGWTDFLFQAMFAATAATIVSGAVAERVKLSSFMLFAVVLVGFAYPISGGWKWGEGWLNDMGFYDFAGSSVVHGFGGFAALACVIVLGPRKGKYSSSGIKPILGSSMPLATIGVFLLWLGWFGFNGGSVLNADPAQISYVCVTTALAAAAGALASIAASWIFLKKPDLSMALNGILAGLVGITAGANAVGVFPSILIGAIAGALVVFAITFFDKIKIDDPVGAISVHGVCGVWGTLAVGLPFFQLAPEPGGDPAPSLGVQLVGTAAIAAFAFVFSFVAFSIIKAVMGVRVDEETEVAGLDVEEHGAPAYATAHAAT